MFKACCYAFLVTLSVMLACSGGGDGGPDIHPPRITSGPSASGIGVRGATIQWTTDKDASSLVFYGISDSYTDSTSRSDLVTTHSIALSDLAPATGYHYMVASEGDGGRVESGDRTFATLLPTGELLDAGWDFFEEAEADSALARFMEAYAYEPERVDVLEALGWTLLRLYRFDAQGGDLSARSVLEAALAKSPDCTDCLVASAFVYYAVEMYEEAVSAAEHALDIAGETYVFEHDPEITTPDVRYCLILGLVATGDFPGAVAEAKLIDHTVDIDPGDASTWSGHSSFEEAVIVMVEGLRDLI
jgi:hypothetical protein